MSAMPWICAFLLGWLESDSDEGMTYDGDPNSPLSLAYDYGRTFGRGALT